MIAVFATCVLSLTNSFVTLAFDDAGRLASLRERVSGRELVVAPKSFVEVRTVGGLVLEPQSLMCTEDELDFDFGVGHAKLRVMPFDGGWTFRTQEFSVPNASNFVFARVEPVCNAKKGSLSNIVMDDRSAVVVRAYTPDLEMIEIVDEGQNEDLPKDRVTWVAATRESGFVGKEAGLCAGPRDQILGMLKVMAKTGKVDLNRCGGPWSLESGVNRAGYLFATWMDVGSFEDWLALLDKSGCRTLHFHAWWKTRGHYEPDICFPGGLDQIRSCVDRLHARGNRASVHTLSAAIQFGDPWISREWFDDFVSDAEYALVRPYRAGDSELYVDRRPWKGHDKILTGSTNGNILRLGDDLLQYSDFTTEPPYRFTGVTIAREPYGDAVTFDATQARQMSVSELNQAVRGVRTLSRSEYPVGQAVSYLHQRYAELYPKPGSRLAELATTRLADVFNVCNFDGIYFDGAEGMGTRYGIDWLRQHTCEKLKTRSGEVFNSTSCRHPFNWWYRSVTGTWDHPNYGPRGFHDRHLAAYLNYSEADFLRMDAGWWNTRGPDAHARGYYPEEMEYFGAKCAAYDATMSIMGAMVSDSPLGFSTDEQLTLLGWWERARYARAFAPEALELLRKLGRDFRLRQDDSGLWTIAPFISHVHRVASEDFASWSLCAQRTGPAGLRIAALYSADRAPSATNSVRMLDATMAASLKANSAEGVVLSWMPARDDERGEVLRLKAENISAPERAAWACLFRQLPEKTFLEPNGVSSLWVCGDGSGATLNVQLRRSPVYDEAYSENLVKLDFVGWRRVDLLLRERDADATMAFDWPYDPKAVICTPAPISRTVVEGKTVDRISLWLNGIPVGKSVDIQVGACDSIPLRKGTMFRGAEVKLNGKSFVLPFELPAGDYAEMKDGSWTHFSASGEPVELIHGADRFCLNTGENSLLFLGRDDVGLARAEVSVFEMEPAVGAFCRLSDDQLNLLSVEYELPVVLNSKKGLAGSFPVHVMPGRSAAVGFEILGPVENPVVMGRKLPIALAGLDERVRCEPDGSWKAVRIVPGICGPENRRVASQRQVLAEGRIEPLPLFSAGKTQISVEAEHSNGARVTFFKEYR